MRGMLPGCCTSLIPVVWLDLLAVYSFLHIAADSSRLSCCRLSWNHRFIWPFSPQNFTLAVDNVFNHCKLLSLFIRCHPSDQMMSCYLSSSGFLLSCDWRRHGLISLDENMVTEVIWRAGTDDIRYSDWRLED